MNAAIHPLDLLTARKIGLGTDGLSRQGLESWQLERLRASVRLTRENSAFYRDRLAGFDETALQSLADVACLPFTTADDIAADPHRFLCVSQSKISRVVTLDTSGTTGKPKRLFFTEADQGITLDFFRDGLRVMARAGDRVLILLPGDIEGSVGELLRRAVRGIGGHPIAGGLPTDIAASAAQAKANAVDLIVGIPVHVLAIARHWRAQGWSEKIATVLLCSDNVPLPIVRELTDIWCCEVFEDWGMTEMGYGGGVDCPAHSGYHLQEADFLFEIVDPESGLPLPAGIAGEIVFTTLTREGMPLIRYRTGDISRILPGPCACGSVLKRLDRIDTRKTGNIALAGMAVSMAALDEAMFALNGVNDFVVTLITNDMPQKLRVGILPTANSDWPSLRPQVSQALSNLAAIDQAVTSGTLRLEIERLEQAPPFTRQKRTIKREQAP